MSGRPCEPPAPIVGATHRVARAQSTSARVGSDAESALSDAAASANDDLDAGAYGGYGDAGAYGAYGDAAGTYGDTVGDSSTGVGCAPNQIEPCQFGVLNGKPGGGILADRR